MKAGCTIVLLLVSSASVSYAPVNSCQAAMSVTIPKEAAYFRELERISHNGLSQQIRANIYTKYGLVEELKSGDQFGTNYGAKFNLVFKGDGAERITGCRMFKSDKRDFHVTVNFQKPGEPVTIRTWWVGMVRLYFTFGKHDNTEGVFILNLEVRPRARGLDPCDWVPKP